MNEIIFKKHIRLWKTDQRFIDANIKNFRLLFYALIIGLLVGLAGSIFFDLLQVILKFSGIACFSMLVIQGF